MGSGFLPFLAFFVPVGIYSSSLALCRVIGAEGQCGQGVRLQGECEWYVMCGAVCSFVFDGWTLDGMMCDVKCCVAVRAFRFRVIV